MQKTQVARFFGSREIYQNKPSAIGHPTLSIRCLSQIRAFFSNMSDDGANSKRAGL